MKKFIMTVAVAGFLAIAGSAQAATFVYEGGLIKVGSMGTKVADLQTCMNGLGHSTGVVDGVFGLNTKAGVMSFQASQGVTADGIIGPVTGPLYTAACAGTTDTTVYPEGCTSAMGYSTTTGLACSATTVDLPEGCTSTTGFSPVTGAKCDGEVSDDTNPTPSVGTEGEVRSYTLGSPDETEALEGESDVEIYAVDVELDDLGDLALERADVWFANSDGASSKKPWDYFKKVSLLVDGKEVASMSADSKSDWSDDYDGELAAVGTTKEYRMRFTELSEVLKSDETTTVSVAVSMLNTIDTADQSASWEIGIDSTKGFKFVDGTGFVFTEGANLDDTFTIGSEETASIKITKATNNPDASVIGVDEDVDTLGKTLAIYNVEEKQNVDVNIDEIRVEFTAVDNAALPATPTTLANIVKKAYLIVDGDTIGTETIPATALVEDVTFDNLNWDLSGNHDKDIEIVVDFKDTNTGARYDAGTTIQVTNFTITAITDANDNEDGDITTLTTAVDGEIQTLELGVPKVTLESKSSSLSDDQKVATFSFTVKVQADGDDVSFDEVTDVVAAVIPGVTAAEVNGNTAIKAVKISGDATLAGSVYTIVDGQDATFAVDITLDPTAIGVYRAELTSFAGTTLEEVAGPESVTVA